MISRITFGNLLKVLQGLNDIDINSKDDLLQVMTALVEALETQSLIPYISAANKTTFAKTLSLHVALSLKNICKKAEQEQLFQIYDSWLQNPFPLLLELGIRKGFLDIIHQFKGIRCN